MGHTIRVIVFLNTSGRIYFLNILMYFVVLTLIYFISALLVSRRNPDSVREGSGTGNMCRCGDRPNSDYETIHTKDGRVLIIRLPQW